MSNVMYRIVHSNRYRYRYRYWSEYNCLLLTEFQSKVSSALGSQESEAEVEAQQGEVCGECRHQRVAFKCEYDAMLDHPTNKHTFKAMSFVQNCKVIMILFFTK